MTNYRSTNEEKQQRINFATDELAKGKNCISKKLTKEIQCKYSTGKLC